MLVGGQAQPGLRCVKPRRSLSEALFALRRVWSADFRLLEWVPSMLHEMLVSVSQLRPLDCGIVLPSPFCSRIHQTSCCQTFEVKMRDLSIPKDCGDARYLQTFAVRRWRHLQTSLRFAELCVDVSGNCPFPVSSK